MEQAVTCHLVLRMFNMRPLPVRIGPRDVTQVLFAPISSRLSAVTCLHPCPFPYSLIPGVKLREAHENEQDADVPRPQPQPHWEPGEHRLKASHEDCEGVSRYKLRGSLVGGSRPAPASAVDGIRDICHGQPERLPIVLRYFSDPPASNAHIDTVKSVVHPSPESRFRKAPETSCQRKSARGQQHNLGRYTPKYP